MNKLYTQLAGSDLKFSRFPFIKVLSLTSIAALLSSVSPVFSKNLSPREGVSTDIKAVSVVSPQSVISVYDEVPGYLGLHDVSKDNYITIPHTALTSNASVLAESSDFIRSIDMNIGSKTTTRASLTPKTVGKEDQIARDGGLGNPLVRGERAKGNSHDAIVYGQVAETNADQGIAIGLTALAGKNRNTKNSIAIGSSLNDKDIEEERTVSVGDFSIAFGSKAHSYANDAIAIGYNAYVIEQAVEGIAIGANAKAAGKFAITMGDQAEATKEDSIAIGRMAHALGKSSTALGSEYNVKSEQGSDDYTTAQGDYSTALGSVSKAMEYGATAVGHRALAKGKQSISVGFYSKANEEKSVTLGDYAVTEVVGGVALGSASVSNVGAGVEGYSPLGKKGEGADFVWKSTQGAVSVGDVKQGKTRQIGGVAAGTEETDAVNIAQLKSLQTYIDKGWKLSVNGKDAKAVGIDDTVDFAAGSKNLEVTKGEKDNNIKFDLAKNITLESVKITDGPQITKDGINVGRKKVTGVAAGNTDTDAVNFAQLKAMQAAAAVKGLKINTTSNDFKDAIADGGDSIAIGSNASASASNSVALGVASQATENGGVAIGAYSVADVDNGKAGYEPFLDRNATKISYEWKSTLGAVSVGNSSIMQSRQITGVAAGTKDVDAVNVAQLKSLKKYVDQGWKLSVDGKNAKAVGINSMVDFAAGSDNLNITKGEGDNNIKFDLAKDITLGSVKAGENTLDAMGLKITGGPQITTEGIDTVGKKITGVAEGTNETDAVNFGQLQKVEKQVEQQVAASSFVQQDDETRSITIGKNTDGDKIDITSTSGASRIISGVADAKNNNDAVNKGQLDTSIKDVNNEITNKYNELTQNITHITQQVKGDALLWSESDNAFVAQHGKEKAKSKIKFLANGDVTEDSTDAINGSQLFATNQNVATVSNNLQTAATKIAETFGGDAKYENGEWTAPTFTLKTVNTDGEEKDETYPDVAKALAGVGSSITNVQNKITNEITNQINNAITKVEGESFIQQDKETNRLTIGAKTEGTEINIANASGASRIISGVADAKNSNEAVNKGQLDKGIENVSKDITNKFNDFTQSITHITQQVKDDALLWSESDNAFVAQHGEEKAKSKLKYLLNGDITAESTDAVNGSQLYSMGNNLAAYLSDGAGYDENGEWKAPTFTLKTVKEDGTAGEESYDTVEKALSAVGTSFTNIQNKITNEVTKEINKTKSDALLWSESDGAFVAQHGEGDKKAESKIMHLKAGDITAESTDAINGSQLYSVIHSLSAYFGGGAGYENGQWNAPTFYVSQFKNDGNGDSKKDYHDVAAAFEGVNGSLSDINERINNVAKDVSSSGLNWNEEEKAFDARHNGEPSKIKYVADGNLSKDSKEAVNGSQLFETNNRVTQVENRVNNIDQKVENIENTVTNGVVKYDKNEKGDKINKVTLAGVSESDPVVLDNVAAGDLSKDSKQAVNGSQLWETNQKMDVVLDKAKEYTDERFNDIINHQMGDVINEAKSYTDMKFDALNYSIEGARKEARQAAAIGIAVANLRYNETPGKLSVGFGTGLWRNKSAFAFGAGYTSESGSVLSNVSVTNSGGHWGIGAGFNMTLN
ncbi:Vomp family autotransporter [Bartonella krasnovii]|uniref:Vomp family autotransporter n=1 Tax=Bartonella krasnovii TaxID=2267275 RepID=UPI001F4CA6FB|nr:Vomp family autotransporter [Bartonella krasnovii]UNF45562.1 Vomp family autotransporter [Bartonella krasnovii]